MQGEVVIGTKLDNKGIDKDIEKLENRLEELRKKGEAPFKIGDVEITGSWNLTDEEQKEYDELNAKLAELELQKSKLLLQEEQITNEIKKQNDAKKEQEYDDKTAAGQALGMSVALEELVKKYNNLSKEKIVSEDQLQEMDNLKKEILDIAQQIEKLTGKKIIIKGITDVKQETPNIKKGLSGIGNELEKLVKKTARWGLAIFGVRSAYLFIRRSVSTLSQYDEGLAQDTQYISYLLASMMKPIVETIVKLVYQLLAYINAIAKGWFGIDLFASASTEEFKKQNQQAQKLSKTMAGFDEMNVLQEDGSTKGASANVPELPDIENIPIPDWIQWIADHGEEIARIIAGITGAVIALKLGFKGLQALGIGIAIYGILEFIKDLLNFIKDPSWEGFIKVIADIGIAIGGLMLLFGNWQGLIIAGIALLVKLVVEHWDEIAGVLGGIGDWIKSHVIDPIANFFGGLWNGIKNGFTSIWNFIMTSFSKGGQIFNGLKDGIVNTFKAIVNTLISGINSVIKIPFDKINGLLNTIRNAKIPVINVKPFKGLWGKNPLPVPKIPKLAKGTILNNPGQGVPVAGGSAIAGEAGREAYLPLSDKQLLSELGSTIGRYVTINATIPVYAYNRQVDRQIRKIRAEDEFAQNW